MVFLLTFLLMLCFTSFLLEQVDVFFFCFTEKVKNSETKDLSVSICSTKQISNIISEKRNYEVAENTATTYSSKMSSKDELFDMFLDEDFVPQAYVDILLNNINIDDLNQVQSLSSGLLTRLDFYTKSLTKELEKNIWNLEKLSQSLPGTWSIVDSSDNQVDHNRSKNSNIGTKISRDPVSPTILNERSARNIGSIGVSKLEYYLDTLGSSVKSLENDLNKLEGDLNQSNKSTQGTDQCEKSKHVMQQLRGLNLVKMRLSEVLTIFTTLRDILVISNAGETESKDKEHIRTFTINDFKLSLFTLQETVEQTLDNAARKERADTVNKEFLAKIEKFVKLRDVFKGFDKFYEEYQKFSKAISQSSTKYLESKDIIDQD